MPTKHDGSVARTILNPGVAPGLALLARLIPSILTKGIHMSDTALSAALAAVESAETDYTTARAASDQGRSAVEAAKSALAPLEAAESEKAKALHEACLALTQYVSGLDPLAAK